MGYRVARVGFRVGRELVRQNWSEKNWSGGACPFRPELLRSPRRGLGLNREEYRTKGLITRRAKIAQMPIGALFAMRLYVPAQSGGVRFKTQRDIHNYTFLENGGRDAPRNFMVAQIAYQKS